MNKYLILLIISFNFLGCKTENMSNQVFIQGGGTLDDWANTSKFAESNEKLMKELDKNRVVFMGNSITEGWSNFDPDFFINNPFINRGISGQTTPQMLIRFKPDVVKLKPKSVVILAGINDIAGNTGPMKIKNIAENMYLYRAQMGLRDGTDGAIQDYLIKVLKIRENIKENYLKEVNKEVIDVLEAYASGINYWMIKNPNNGYDHFFPISSEDIIAGFSIQNLFFSGVISSIERLQREAEVKEEYTALYKNEQFVTGSNVLAVNSKKTSDQSTRIIINSHQPLDGPLAWYEAHIKSDDGWNMMGGLFPGSCPIPSSECRAPVPRRRRGWSAPSSLFRTIPRGRHCRRGF